MCTRSFKVLTFESYRCHCNVSDCNSRFVVVCVQSFFFMSRHINQSEQVWVFPLYLWWVTCPPAHAVTSPRLSTCHRPGPSSVSDHGWLTSLHIHTHTYSHRITATEKSVMDALSVSVSQKLGTFIFIHSTHMSKSVYPASPPNIFNIIWLLWCVLLD